MITYLDTSAVAKLLADEAETSALRKHLDDRVTSGDADLVSACLLETGLRSMDALHIAAALQAGANEFITYDARQQAAAEAVGLRVRTPGRT